MRPRKMKNFHFSMLQNETKFLQKWRNNIITTEEKRIRSSQRFTLSNKKTIINE